MGFGEGCKHPSRAMAKPTRQPMFRVIWPFRGSPEALALTSTGASCFLAEGFGLRSKCRTRGALLASLLGGAAPCVLLRCILLASATAVCGEATSLLCCNYS